MTPLDLSDVARLEVEYRDKIGAVKDATPRDFEWYPYSTLVNFHLIEQTITGANRNLRALAGDEAILDLCCADGELAFFLESLGFDKVRAVDLPTPNYNRMKGVRALKEAIGSKVEIVIADIDSQFTLPNEHYGLAFFLGALYHLKNPYYALETLAKHTRYCILSTRVARRPPDRRFDYASLPLAYLVDPSETNNDPSNYWIFTEAGLRRVLERAQWGILDFKTFGNTTDSDPASADGDERAFCLLESKIPAFRPTVDLLHGWHGIEGGSWRWTERRFAVAIDPAAPARITLNVAVPELLIDPLGPITLRALAHGEDIVLDCYDKTGRFELIADVPAGTSRVDFETDKWLAPDSRDGRERAIIVSAISVTQR